MRKEHNEKTASIVVDGHPISITFAKEPSPQISRLIRDCLIDSYIRQRRQSPQGMSSAE